MVAVLLPPRCAVPQRASPPRIHARAFVTTTGHRKLLLVNKTAAPVTVVVPDCPGMPTLGQVDISTIEGGTPEAVEKGTVRVGAHSTAVVSY